MKGRNRERGFTPHHFWLKSGAGFTFIEALLAIVILAIMIQVIYQLYLSNFQVWRTVVVLTEVRQDAGWAMEGITRVLREAREISGAGRNQITFWWKDIDGDEVRDADETVSYSWSGLPGEDLYRTAKGASVKLASKVKNFQLEYRDGNDNILPFPVVQPTDIRHITINLGIESERKSMVLRSGVRLRNL